MAITPSTISDPAFALGREFSVEPYDLDRRGLISEFACLRWLETLRTDLLHRDFGDLPRRYVPTLVSNHLQYHQPMGAPTRIEGRIWLANLGRRQWTLQVSLGPLEETAAFPAGSRRMTAVQVGQFIDLSTMTPIDLPAAITHRYWNHQWTL